MLDNFSSSFTNFFGRIKTNEKLYQENSEFKKKLYDLENNLVQCQKNVDKLSKLNQGYNYSINRDDFFLTANLIAISPGPNKKEAIIRAGKRDDVNLGDIVLYKGKLLGRIIKIYE